MNFGTTIFSQLMDFLSIYEFSKCVKRYVGNYKVKSFSCWDQLLCMAFAQLTYRENLRDIEACLRSFQNKLYHMGIRAKSRHNPGTFNFYLDSGEKRLRASSAARHGAKTSGGLRSAPRGLCPME